VTKPLKKLTEEQRQLVETHLYIVDVLCQKSHHFIRAKTRGLEDIRQEGYIGLCKAAARFKPEKQFAFSTLAYYYARGHILDAVRYRRNQPLPARNDETPAEPSYESDNDPFWLEGFAKHLDPKDLLLLQRLYSDGVAPKHLAKERGVPTEKIHNAHFCVIKKLRTAFKDMGYGQPADYQHDLRHLSDHQRHQHS